MSLRRHGGLLFFSMYQLQLQDRDLEMLTPLVHCYRITTSAAEAARLNVSVSTTSKRLSKLTAAGFLVRLSALMSTLPPIQKRLCKWAPGDPDPNTGAIAYAAQKRWHDRPLKKTTIYTASKKLLTYFGLPPRPHIKTLHASHDYGVLQCYEFCRQKFPSCDFVGEDMFAPRGHGVAVEDAQLVQGDKVFAVVDFIGSYRKSRVQHLHKEVGLERGLRYLLF